MSVEKTAASSTSEAISRGRGEHLARLWKAYTDHDVPRQADKWLAQYFREHKSYGKRDRAWYSEAFFTRLRTIIAELPLNKTVDAATVWAELRKPVEPGSPGAAEAASDVIHASALPQTWKVWLAHTSLAPAALPQFLEQLRGKPPLYLRANYAEKADEIENELKETGFEFTTTRRDSGLITFAVKGTTPIYELQALKKGFIEIQDLASQLLGEAVDAHPGMSVWDVCAGGGGKTLQIASQMKNRGVLYASDIRDYKLDELKLRARRGGFHNVRRFVYDAEQAPELTKEITNSGGFHRILVDAPCTSSGTLRRNPDVRFRIQNDDPEKFAALQLKILLAVAPNLRAQGKLIYSTCSVFRTENEDVVAKFIDAQPQFKVMESKLVGSPEIDADAMFYCVLMKG